MFRRLEAGVTTDVGRNPKRERNEDTYLVRSDLGLFGVFDGMGGMAAGEVASKLARDTFEKCLATQLPLPAGTEASAVRAVLTEALQAADTMILQESKEHFGPGMGSTAVVGLLAGDTLYLANLGDSRAYLLRQGALTRQSTDHTVGAVLVELKELTEDEARQSGARNRLLAYLGGMGQNQPSFFPIAPLLPGDRVLLCSDGVWEVLPEVQLRSLLTHAIDTAEAARTLVESANDAGSTDNVTALTLFADPQS